MAGHPPYGNIGGLPYFNLRLSTSPPRLHPGLGGLARKGLKEALGRVPDGARGTLAILEQP